MTFWIGVDEAGYGPNLGPLVVCASVWTTELGCELESWYPRLSKYYCRVDDRDAADPRFIIDDSKRVYQTGKGLGGLERTVLMLAALCQAQADDADAFRNWLDSSQRHCNERSRFRTAPTLRLPVCLEIEKELRDLERREAMMEAEIRCTRLLGKLVFPAPFNEQLIQHNNKATILAETTMGVVLEALALARREDAVILCDKQGGRDRYFALLSHYFPEERITIVREGEGESVYRWEGDLGKREIRFSAKGDRQLPTAAASMTAKYVRELCMAEWNAFWAEKIPGIAPTAGYPVDARRFRHAIEGVAAELGFTEAMYWRRK